MKGSGKYNLSFQEFKYNQLTALTAIGKIR